MRVIIIHGWMEYPSFAWFPWLRKELESRGHQVDVPLLPNPDFPDRETWVHIVRDAIKTPDTILICHSLGCPTALLALQDYEGESLAQVVIVAGFARPFLLALRPWFMDAKFDFEKIKGKAKKWTFMHSEKDLVVPYAEGKWLADCLQGTLMKIEKGHAMQEEGVLELPELLEVLE